MIDPSGNRTYGLSIAANANIFVGGIIPCGLFFDDHGNFEGQWSYACPGVNDTISVGLFDVGKGSFGANLKH